MRALLATIKPAFAVPAGIVGMLLGMPFAAGYAVSNPYPLIEPAGWSAALRIEPDVTVIEHPNIIAPITLEQARDDYLWAVYERMPVKKDGAGDFTWKDPAAAKRVGKTTKDYVIGGMSEKLRDRLYKVGKEIDEKIGPKWSICSGFRDDYRQKIADGYKAHGGNSQHGGSRATCGYGCGRAADVCGPPEIIGQIFRLFDSLGRKAGLVRPMPGADPYHVQLAGNIDTDKHVASHKAKHRYAKRHRHHRTARRHHSRRAHVAQAEQQQQWSWQ